MFSHAFSATRKMIWYFWTWSRGYTSATNKTNKDKLFVRIARPTARIWPKSLFMPKHCKIHTLGWINFEKSKSLFKPKPTKIQGNTLNKLFPWSYYWKPVFLYKKFSLFVFYIADIHMAMYMATWHHWWLSIWSYMAMYRVGVLGW